MSGKEEPLEYEQMRLFNLFSEEEIRQIHKKRKLFEFQIELPHKQIKYFLEYIKYERKLIKDIKERIQKQNIMEEDKMVPSIAVRIKQIYSKALAIFSHSARFWDEYIKFLQQFKFYDKISEAFQKMLKIHDDKPEVWCRAIHWEHHENFENGHFHDLIKTAKLKHPESLSVFLTIFQVELEERRKRNVYEAIEYLDECYRNGKEKFPQIEFYFGMLQIVDKLSYARPMQQTILVDVRMEYLHNEFLWHTLAQRELHGMTVNDNSKHFADEHHQDDDDSKSSFSKSQSSDHSVSLRPMRTRIKACVETYKEGIEHVESEQMWKYYLDCMLELNKDLTTQLTLKKAILNDAVHFAKEKSIQMSEDQYIKYIEIISKHKARVDYIKSVVQKATMLYTTSASLWLLRLRLYMQLKDFKNVRETFCESRNYLEDGSAEIWRWYFIYIKSHAAPPDEYERFVFDLANQRNPDFNIIKSYVLELLESTKGYEKAVETCDLFLRYCPQCPVILKWKTDLQTRYEELDRLIGGQTEVYNGANGSDNKKTKVKKPKTKTNGRVNSKRMAQLKIREK